LSEQRVVEGQENAAPKEYFWGTGRRKSSGARVRLSRGTGKITVNGRELTVFFKEDKDRNQVRAAFDATKTSGLYDCVATAAGGGITGQAGAVSLGIARALLKIDEKNIVGLREASLLTRDSRMKERKKYGLHGARRGTQFSKR
jgi:small subunit ribosomal protein S9